MSDVGRITAVLDIDDDDFQDKMGNAEDKANDFPDIESALKLDDSDFSDKYDEAMQKADDLSGRDVNVPLSADDQASGPIDDVSAKADELSGKEANVNIRAEGAEEANVAIEGVQNSLESIQGMMEGMGELAIFAGTIAGAYELGEALQEDIDKYGELQYAATGASLKAGPGQSATVTPEIQKVADELAVKMGRSSSDIANVMGTLMGYGENPTGMSAESLQPFMNLGVLPGVGMGNATDLIERASKNFKGTTQQSAADMIARTLESSNIQAGNLSGAMSKGSLAANTAGIDLPGLLSMYRQENVQRGFDPSQVNMALTTASNKLTEPLDITDKLNKKTGEVTQTYKGFAKSLNDQGISFDAVTNKSDSFLQKLVNLDKQGADFGKLFGARQGQILKDLADNAQGVDDFSNTLKSSQGDVQGYADTMEGTWEESMNRAGAAVDSLEKKIGGDLEPAAAEFVNYMSTSGREAAELFIQGLETGDFSPFLQKIQGIQTDIENYFRNINYDTIGEDLKNGLVGAWNYGWSQVTAATNWEHLFGDLNGVGAAVMGIIGPSLLAAFQGMAYYAEGSIVAIEVGFDQLGNAGQRAFEFATIAATMFADELNGDVSIALGTVLKALGQIAGSAAPIADYVHNNIEVPIDNTLNDPNGLGKVKIGNAQTGMDTGLPEWETGKTIWDYIPNDVLTIKSYDPNELHTMQDLSMVDDNANYGTSNSGSAFDNSGSLASSPSALSAPSSSTPGTQGSGSSVSSYADDMASKGYVTDDGKTWHLPGSTEALPQDTTKTNEHTIAVVDGTTKTKGNSAATSESSASLAAFSIETIDAGDALIAYGNLQKNASKDLAAGDLAAIKAVLGHDPTKTIDVAADTLHKQVEYEAALNATDDTVDILKQGLFESNDAAFKFGDGLYKVDDALKNTTRDANSAADAQSKAASQLQGQNVGYDALKNTLAGCEDAMSEFGKWQEANAGTLFNASYEGSNAGYPAFLDQENARGAVHPAVENVGIDYSKAQDDAMQLSTIVTKEEKKPVSLDDTAALADADRLQGDLSQPAYKNVYVNQINGGAGGNTSNEAWMNDFNPSVPSFAIGDVYVPRPTLAIVGDRPGGEWIGGMDQAAQRFGGGQQQGEAVGITNNNDFRGAFIGFDSVEKLADILVEQIQHKLTML